MFPTIPPPEGLKRARGRRHREPPSSITSKFGKDREAFERALQDELAAHQIELVCLAGFMRLLTPWFVRQWDGRLLNIHPALLPAFKGLDTHARALEAGAKEHGATVHFVVPEMDSGPIIAQAAVPVHDGDTEATLAARVLEVEHRIYPQALRLVAEGRVRIAGRPLPDRRATRRRDRNSKTGQETGGNTATAPPGSIRVALQAQRARSWCASARWALTPPR